MQLMKGEYLAVYDPIEREGSVLIHVPGKFACLSRIMTSHLGRSKVVGLSQAHSKNAIADRKSTAEEAEREKSAPRIVHAQKLYLWYDIILESSGGTQLTRLPTRTDVAEGHLV
jgi:hypothetical protein